MEHKHGEVTIEQLAGMINKGFNDAKKDIRRVEDRLDNLDAKVDNLDARVARIQMDIHELRGEVVYRHEFEDVLGRVKYLEKKLGIESGV